MYINSSFITLPYCGNLSPSPSLSLCAGVAPGPSAAWPVDYCLLMFQSAVCWGMWSYLTWTSPGVPRRRSVWAPPPSPALGTKLSHKHNHTLATPGLQLRASHRREMGKTLHQGDGINLKTNKLAKSRLTPALPQEKPADLHDKKLKHQILMRVYMELTLFYILAPFLCVKTRTIKVVSILWIHRAALTSSLIRTLATVFKLL